MEKFLKDEKGNVLVIFVLVLAIFVGMSTVVTDMGRSYLTKSHLQNAVDAAALAAAQDLKNDSTGDAAKAKAIQYLGKYDVLSTEYVDPVLSNYSTTDNCYKKIQVSVTRDLPYNINILGKLYGSGVHTVSATATAVIGGVISGDNIDPIGVVEPETPWPTGTELQLLGTNDHDYHKPWWGWVYIDGNKNPANIIKDGDPVFVEVSDSETIKEGMVDAAVQAIYDRITAAGSTATWNDYISNPSLYQDDPHLITILVITPPEGQGNPTTTIQAFAQFWITDISVSGSDKHINGKYIQTLTSNSTIDPNQTIVGLYGVKLIK